MPTTGSASTHHVGEHAGLSTGSSSTTARAPATPNARMAGADDARQAEPRQDAEHAERGQLLDGDGQGASPHRIELAHQAWHL
jgi:hypothetical protein